VLTVDLIGTFVNIVFSEAEHHAAFGDQPSIKNIVFL